MSFEVTEEFARERREAILSMDKERIVSLLKKYNLFIPMDERDFWIGVHYAKVLDTCISKEERNRSYKWLMDRGIDVFPQFLKETDSPVQ